MKRHVAAHQVERVSGVGGMDRRAQPSISGQLLQSGDELQSRLGEADQGGLEIHLQEPVVRLIRRLIRHDCRTVFREDARQASRPYWFHQGQMAEVLMGGPLGRLGTPLEIRRGHRGEELGEQCRRLCNVGNDALSRSHED